MPRELFPVWPDDSCARCRRGDTKTVTFVKGTPSLVESGVLAITDLSRDEAQAAVDEIAQRGGAEPRELWEGMRTVFVRLCEDCAADRGVPVDELPDSP